MDKKILSENPLVYTIEDVLTKEECQHFINISNNKLKQALVSGEKEGYKSSGRTGLNYWLDHNYDKITSNVLEKISKIVGHPKENAEKYQVIYYGENQKYEYHLDAFQLDINSEKSKRCLRMGGQRVLTALVYLNDTEEGGETEFKNLNLKVYPKTGRMLVFENCLKNTKIPNPDTLHSGRPVLRGEKYAFNLWFREYPLNYNYDLELELKNQSKIS
jgi:prolyl 4-hydroxylase